MIPPNNTEGYIRAQLLKIILPFSDYQGEDAHGFECTNFVLSDKTTPKLLLDALVKLVFAMVSRKDIGWKPVETLSDLQFGDMVRLKDENLHRSFFIHGDFGGRMTAVATVDVTNPIEWELYMEPYGWIEMDKLSAVKTGWLVRHKGSDKREFIVVKGGAHNLTAVASVEIKNDAANWEVYK